jgi:sugar phosphate isomerase/epimerase
VSLVALSTASVYPESSAHAFAYAKSLGYDAVEVMVGIDALSQQTAAVKQLSDHHELPICAIHSPCLLFTQRVWGTDPWGKLERSAEMAHAVGADVVVVHPPFRWQRSTPPGSSTASRPSRSPPAWRSPSRTCTRGAPRPRAASRCTSPGGTRRTRTTPTRTVDLSHAAIAQSSPVDMAERLGAAAAARAPDRRLRVAQGRAPRPRSRAMDAQGSCEYLSSVGFAGHIVLEINTRKAGTREEREADLRESLEFARTHFRA